MKRWLVFALLAFWGVVALCADPAGAARLSACTPHRGTVVAVDFAHWGGPLVRGCGIDQPSGYALLHAAGFTTAGDAHDGAAFICRIGNEAFDAGALHPTPSEDPCNGTPSTSAYWSYWLAPAGQNTWTYSQAGPMGDVPKPGEVELWTFGSTNVAGTRGSGVPRFPPSALRAANGAPTPRTPPATTTAPTTTTGATSAPASRPKTGHRSTATRRAATGSRQPRRPARKRPRAPGPDHKAAAGAASVALSRRTRPAVVSARPTAEHTSSGSAGPLVVGLCLASVLVAGAVWTVRRRRRYE